MGNLIAEILLILIVLCIVVIHISYYMYSNYVRYKNIELMRYKHRNELKHRQDLLYCKKLNKLYLDGVGSPVVINYIGNGRIGNISTCVLKILNVSDKVIIAIEFELFNYNIFKEFISSTNKIQVIRLNVFEPLNIDVVNNGISNNTRVECKIKRVLFDDDSVWYSK